MLQELKILAWCIHIHTCMLQELKIMISRSATDETEACGTTTGDASAQLPLPTKLPPPPATANSQVEADR